MPLDLVKYYSAEIISALELMHSKNMIHRDLKPENILITEDWNIKLVSINYQLILQIDFGDSCRIENGKEKFEDKKEAPGKRKATFVGTPLYVSPEML